MRTIDRFVKDVGDSLGRGSPALCTPVIEATEDKVFDNVSESGTTVYKTNPNQKRRMGV